MNLDEVLRTLGLKKSEVKFFYMEVDRPYEVEILNSTRRGNCNIIRKEPYNGNKGSKIFVYMYALWIKTPKRFIKVSELLREINELE